MKIENYPRKGKKYILYMKKMSEIESIAVKIDNDADLNRVNIHHSTGNGGGLPLKNGFIKAYCGTAKALNVEFHRQTNNRFLYETIPKFQGDRAILLYGEWLQEFPDNTFLENDLFEI